MTEKLYTDELIKEKHIMPFGNTNENIFLEGLPSPRYGNEIEEAYTKKWTDFDYDTVKKLSSEERLNLLQELKFHINVPFEYEKRIFFLLKKLKNYLYRKLIVKMKLSLFALFQDNCFISVVIVNKHSFELVDGTSVSAICGVIR